MQEIHDRMPVILDNASLDGWLSPEIHEPQELRELMTPCPDGWLLAVEVSPLVNSPTTIRQKFSNPQPPLAVRVLLSVFCLGEMEVLVRVMESGSFSAAARDLKLSQPDVSKTIAELEDRLGVRLLVRSTRRLSSTEAGDALYERPLRAIAEANETEAAAQGARARLEGRNPKIEAAIFDAKAGHNLGDNFGLLYERYYRTVLRMLLRRGINPEIAEECAQHDRLHS